MQYKMKKINSAIKVMTRHKLLLLQSIPARKSVDGKGIDYKAIADDTPLPSGELTALAKGALLVPDQP